LPTELARGPWSPEALHGGPPSALLLAGAEPLIAGMHPARLTVELLRPVPLTPLRLSAHVSRPGRKVRLVEAQLMTDETIVAKATLLGIRVEDTDVPSSPMPHPPKGPEQSPTEVPETSAGPRYEAFHNAGVEHRFAEGHFGEPGPATDWIRLRVPVVPGQAPSGMQRVAAAADFGNGISSILTMGEATFINPDLTVYLHRLPVGEWVGLEAVTVLQPQGVGLAESRLWDEDGSIGRSLQSLLVEGPTVTG